MDEMITERAIAYVQALFSGDDRGDRGRFSVSGMSNKETENRPLSPLSPSHDASHALRVYRNTLTIAESEPACDVQAAALAAILHDADDHKFFQTNDNANARAFLLENHVAPERIEKICGIINSVSFSRNHGKAPDTLEGKIVQDADRLDAIGAIGVARTFSYGGEHGRPMKESIQHFHDKLLRLKDLMNTETGRQMAGKRHAFLETFLKAYNEESSPAGQAAIHPMRVFISYGHPESEICRRICQALKNRGHDPWFDAENLHHGLDWREEITLGLSKSDRVISCLSRHSVRDPGVCLDELSIAVGIKGGNIQTILLEDENKIIPPASLSHRQWLDMSEWRVKLAEGNAVFDPWFSGKMKQLYQVIESRESREFVGQITAIRKKLFVNYDTGKQNALLAQLFIGRKWLDKQVEAWLDDPDGSRLCILTGDPGVGKSAYAAHFIHRSPRIAAGLFCEYDRPLYSDPRTVIMTLAYLLACRLPAYRVLLAGILEEEKRLGEMNAAELFGRLLADPLGTCMIDGRHETLCIVIDGLDECGTVQQNALVEALGRYAFRLPPWLRILALSRDVASIRNPMEGAHHLELRGSQAQNMEDVREYFTAALAEKFASAPGWQDALRTMTDRSGGIFLYARLVANGILQGNLSLFDTDALPMGLSEAFSKWFGSAFPDPDEYRQNFRLPIGMLLAAPAPLPTEELCRLFGWNENELNDFLLRTEILLVHGQNAFRKETIAFSHKYISEWLDTPRAGQYRSSRRGALEYMAQGFYDLFTANAQSLTAYESLYLLSLLEQTGRTDELEKAGTSRDLYKNVFKAGDFCKDWSEYSLSLKCYQLAERIAGAAGAPGRDTCAACDRIGEILQTRGDLEGALAYYERSFEIRSQLKAAQPAAKSDSELSISLNKMSGIYQAKGDLEASLAYARQGLTLRQQLAISSGTPQARRIYAISCIKVGDLLQLSGEWEKALPYFDKSLEIFEQLDAESGTQISKRDLSVSYIFVGELKLKQEAFGEALAFFRKSLAIREALADEIGTPQTRRDVSVCCNWVGTAYQKLGNFTQAMFYYQKGFRIAEKLAAEVGTPQARRDLAISLEKIKGLPQ